jgi:hypothetical protein
MRTTIILLSGAAAVALMGAASTPVLAQYVGNSPQYSTPAERAETEQLNEQNIEGTTQSPSVLNGESQPLFPQPYGTYSGYDQNGQPIVSRDYNGNPSGSFGGYSQSGPAPAYAQGEQDQNADGPQQQYNQQMQQYQGQQQDYQNQRNQYEQQKDRYDHNIRWYDQTRWSYDYPHPFAYEYDRPQLTRLYLLAEPSQQLADVPIEGPNGMWVGRIRDVETGPDGRPARIEVALNRRVSIWVGPEHFRFDSRERVAYTNLTREDLWQMPGARVESSPM